MPGRITNWLNTILSAETRSGIITVGVAILTIVWANTPFADFYNAIIHAAFRVPGFEMDVHQFAADFLLAFFFLVIGIELRHELSVGSLNSTSKAVIPVAAAIGGMAIPALIYTAFNVGHDSAAGWGIPMATDIAFALAVLALVVPRSKPALRTFLLALAVVDDLGAISVIAVFYTPEIHAAAFGLAVAVIVALWGIQRTRFGHPILLFVLGLVAWWFVFQSGVHATIAGVVIGMLLSTKPGTRGALAERALSTFLPVSTYVAVPVFVFVSSGVTFAAMDAASFLSPVFLGIVVGLLVGKPVGIVSFVWIAERFFGGRRDASLGYRDVALVGVVASIGFTVALLINDRVFGYSPNATIGTAAVIIAAVLGAIASAIAAKRVPA